MEHAIDRIEFERSGEYPKIVSWTVECSCRVILSGGIVQQKEPYDFDGILSDAVKVHREHARIHAEECSTRVG